MADQNSFNLHIFEKFLNFDLIWKWNIFFLSAWPFYSKKNVIFLWMSVHVRFKILVPVETKTSIRLDRIDWFRSNFIYKVIKAYFKVLWENMTSHDPDYVMRGHINNFMRNTKAGGYICWFLSQFQTIFILA